MNWNDLKYFLAIAETGSLSGAAKKLDVNHSTVFRRLEAYEESLQSQLFDRFNNGYRLTPAGEKLLQIAREADKAVQKINLEIAGQDIALTGKVRVTAPPNIAQSVMPDVVRELRSSYPGIVVEIATSDSDFDLNRREADIALRATTAPPAHLVGRYLVTLGWWVYATEELAASFQTDPQLRQFIGSDASMRRLDAFRWLESEHGGQIVARSNDLSTMARLAIAGIACAVLPEDQKHEELVKVTRVPATFGQLWLLTHPDLRDIRRIRVVWDAIAEAVTNHYGSRN